MVAPCTSSSYDHPSYRNPKDELVHRTRDQGRCGVVLLLQGPSGERKLVYRPCRRLVCDDCGPRLRAERVDAYLDAIGTTDVVKLMVTRDRWPTLYRKLHRDGSEYLKFDRPDGRLVVFASVSRSALGLIVTDLAEALTRAYEDLPAGARVSSSRGWKLATVVPKEPSGWTVLAQTPELMDAVIEAAERFGFTIRPDGSLPRQIPEAAFQAWYTFCHFREPTDRAWGIAA